MATPNIKKLRKTVNGEPQSASNGEDEDVSGWAWAIVLFVVYVALKKWHVL